MEHYATVVGLKVIYESEPANERLDRARRGLRGSDLETETFSLRFPIDLGDCENCYRVRLKMTAEKAKELEFDRFSTTLLISPYQDHELLKRIGQELSNEVGIRFHYEDFRPGFRRGQQLAKEMNLYRQKYCGCGVDLIAKEEESYAQAG
jgi:hypothetical protein